jgi:hypothetical protein
MSPPPASIEHEGAPKAAKDADDLTPQERRANLELDRAHRRLARFEDEQCSTSNVNYSGIVGYWTEGGRDYPIARMSDGALAWDATAFGTAYIPHTIISDEEGGEL